MTEVERRAVFYKSEHEVPVNLVGTDLKPFTEHSDRFTLAVPKADNLDKLAAKIEIFGTARLRRVMSPTSS